MWQRTLILIIGQHRDERDGVVNNKDNKQADRQTDRIHIVENMTLHLRVAADITFFFHVALVSVTLPW